LVIGVRVDSDGDVIAFLHEIDVPVFRDDFEADFRGDLGESGCDPAHRDVAEHQRRADCAAVRVNPPCAATSADRRLSEVSVAPGARPLV
jgi:hypothetical protein